MCLYRSARLAVACVLLAASWTHAQPPSQDSQSNAEIQIIVRSDGGPIARAQVVVRGNTSETDADGRTIFHVQPGPLEITVVNVNAGARSPQFADLGCPLFSDVVVL
jgi:hypothetical protein